MASEVRTLAQRSAEAARQIKDLIGRNVEQVTQQNAALVEQSAAAAESLRENARQMAEMVAVFKVGGAQGAPLLPAAGASRPAGDGPARRTPSTTGRVSAAYSANGDWSSF